MAEKLFTKEAVKAAINLTARASAGVADREGAHKVLDSLPEELSEIVMTQVIEACKERAAIKASIIAKAFRTLSQSLLEEKKD